MSRTSPATRIITALGGYEATRRVVNLRSTTAIRKWEYPIERGGTGGRIPSKYHATILTAAAERGIKIRPADLVEIPVSAGGV